MNGVAFVVQFLLMMPFLLSLLLSGWFFVVFVFLDVLPVVTVGVGVGVELIINCACVELYFFRFLGFLINFN